MRWEDDQPEKVCDRSTPDALKKEIQTRHANGALLGTLLDQYNPKDVVEALKPEDGVYE